MIVSYARQSTTASNVKTNIASAAIAQAQWSMVSVHRSDLIWVLLVLKSVVTLGFLVFWTCAHANIDVSYTAC